MAGTRCRRVTGARVGAGTGAAGAACGEADSRETPLLPPDRTDSEDPSTRRSGKEKLR